MAEKTIVAGAFKIPNGFELTGVMSPARMTMKAPDGSTIDFTVEIKAFEPQEFFESIEKFKEQVNQE